MHLTCGGPLLLGGIAPSGTSLSGISGGPRRWGLVGVHVDNRCHANVFHDVAVFPFLCEALSADAAAVVLARLLHGGEGVAELLRFPSFIICCPGCLSREYLISLSRGPFQIVDKARASSSDAFTSPYVHFRKSRSAEVLSMSNGEMTTQVSKRVLDAEVCEAGERVLTCR